MRISSIFLENFPNFDQVTVNFDKNVTYLIGRNGSGKSTIGITAVWYMFQGIAEKSSGGNQPLIGERFRFIGPESAMAKGTMILHDDEKGIDIKVIRKLTKAGNVVEFVAPEGYNLDQAWLTNLFNLFLIAPKKFTELSSQAQATTLGIDTSVYDKKIVDLKSEYTIINRNIKDIGTLVPVPFAEPVDFSALSAEKDAMIAFNQEQEAKQRAIEDTQVAVTNLQTEQAEVEQQIRELQLKLEGIKDQIAHGELYITELPKPLALKFLDDINKQISNATATNISANNYQAYENKRVALMAKEEELAANKTKQGEELERRLQYIRSFKLPFDELSVDEEGKLLFNDKPIKEPYFSTGELLRIVPILISSKNPELKYVFIQDFNLLDEDNQKEIESYLVEKGFQLVVELVGKDRIPDKNCIVLKDCKVVPEEEPVLVQQPS